MDKKLQGKKNRASGADFERRTRADLESKGWIVDKWGNNIEFEKENSLEVSGKLGGKFGKLIPAKHKFCGTGRPMAMGTGFPDFICIKVHDLSNPQTYYIQFVECKTNGYLDKTEKEKCRWMVDNLGVRILIASKLKEGRKVVIKYTDFEDIWAKQK